MMSTEEFRAKLLEMLNSCWPHKSEIHDDTPHKALALAAQLHNWATAKGPRL